MHLLKYMAKKQTIAEMFTIIALSMGREIMRYFNFLLSVFSTFSLVNPCLCDLSIWICENKFNGFIRIVG